MATPATLTPTPEQEAVLDAYLTGCDGDRRRGFLEVAARKGYLKADPGVEVDGPCNPPKRPAQLKSILMSL